MFGAGGCHGLCRRNCKKGDGEPTSRRKIREGTLQRCQRKRQQLGGQEQGCWGRGDPSEAGERVSERMRSGRDRGLCSRCRSLMGAEAGPADRGRDGQRVPLGYLHRCWCRVVPAVDSPAV